MTGLPQGWATITIGEASGVGGLSTDGDWIESKDQDPTGSVRLIQLQDIGDGTFVNKSSRFLTEEKAEELNCTFLAPGDVLIARMPDPLGRACRFPDIGQKSVTAVDVHVWRKGEHGVEPDFLVYCVNSPEIRQSLQAQASGTTRQRVSGGRLKAQEIPLPPLPEQRRIVRKLDTLSARSTTARTHLTAIEKLVERYKSSVLLAAFRGQLTSDLRGPSNDSIHVTITDPFTYTQIAPASWTRHLFSEVCRIVGGSQPPKSTFVYAPQEGYIRLVQIRDYKSDAKATYIPADLARRFCSPSDIMIGRYGPPIFQILRGIEGAYNVALMKAEPTEAVDQEFLYWYLHHPILFRYVEIDSKRTAGQDGVNKAHLERWPILLPPLDEQREIVRRIEAAFAKIDRLKAEAAKALKLLGHLDQRILAKAFAGDLVPQDPTDEPAETLLARIREARTTAQKGKRRRTATTG